MRKNSSVYGIIFFIAKKYEDFEDFSFKYLGLDYFEWIMAIFFILYAILVIADAPLALTTVLLSGTVLFPLLVGICASIYVDFQASPDNKHIQTIKDDSI